MSARKPLAALLLLGLIGTTPLLAAAAPPGVAAAAREDIRDIRGPVSIPSWWRWLAAGAAAALLAALGAAVVVAVARRRRRPLSAHERALARLAAAAPLAEAGEVRAYAAAASDAVREYIEERFVLRAAHLTTDEFFAALGAQDEPRLGAHHERLRAFLGACDLAKFARLALPREELASLNESARQFVLATAPTPASPDTARTS